MRSVVLSPRLFCALSTVLLDEEVRTAMLLSIVVVAVVVDVAVVDDDDDVVDVAAVAFVVAAVVIAAAAAAVSRSGKAERSLKMYGMLPYFLSKMIAELPISALFPTIFGAILYPMTGLHPKRDRRGTRDGLRHRHEAHKKYPGKKVPAKIGLLPPSKAGVLVFLFVNLSGPVSYTHLTLPTIYSV